MYITSACNVLQFQNYSELENGNTYTYETMSLEKVIYFQFANNITCSGVVISAQLSNGNEFPSSFATFNSTDKTLTILSTSTSDLGTYTFNILVKDQTETNILGTLEFILVISYTISTETTISVSPPYFSPALQNIEIDEEEIYVYDLPTYLCDGGCTIDLTVDLGASQNFVTYSQEKFYILPQIGDSGTYSVILTL